MEVVEVTDTKYGSTGIPLQVLNLTDSIFDQKKLRYNHLMIHYVNYRW